MYTWWTFIQLYEIMSSARKHMEMEIIMLNKISQAQKDRHDVLSLVYVN